MKALSTTPGYSFIRIGALVLAAASIIVLANGCDGGREGDRCNPAQSSNECGSGLTCQQPSTCVESYCCPADPSKSSSNYCNGNLCPPSDSGAPASDDSGAAADSGAVPGDGGSD